jgi:uncharacterized membrane protein YeaQ/YmgE (transglycosylase-associated protein family)
VPDLGGPASSLVLAAAFTFKGKRKMDLQALIIFLAIGAVAGWLAGTLMKGGGFGLLGNIIVGVIGAVVGGFVFGLLGISAGGLIGSIITATVGAALLLFLIGLIKKT